LKQFKEIMNTAPIQPTYQPPPILNFARLSPRDYHAIGLCAALEEKTIEAWTLDAARTCASARLEVITQDDLCAVS